MPFVSEKQRKFMWMKHPNIARRWEKEEKEETDKKAMKMLSKGGGKKRK